MPLIIISPITFFFIQMTFVDLAAFDSQSRGSFVLDFAIVDNPLGEHDSDTQRVFLST